MAPKSINTNKEQFADIKRWAEEATADWLADHANERFVKAAVEKFFSNKWRAEALSLMGMESSFGRLEVTSKNRDGLLLGTFPQRLSEMVRAACTKHLERIFKDPPVLTGEEVEMMRKYYKDELTSSLRYALRTRAGEEAKKLVDHIVAELNEEGG